MVAVTGGVGDIPIEESVLGSKFLRLLTGSLCMVDSFIPQDYIEC